MSQDIKVCPVCGQRPEIWYACGEYFVAGTENCRFCGEFTEMHSSKEGEVACWNEAVDDELQCGCPLGGDKTDDCADCAYSEDYHYVNGECVRRDNICKLLN